MPQNIRIVLIQPEFAGNLGSVARAMGNMDFQELVLVDPQPALDDFEVKKMAVACYPIIEQAKIVRELTDAISDCHWVVGFTRRAGRHRREFLPITDLAPETQKHLATKHKIAFVFGTEKNGFTTSEASRCQQLVEIPTSETHPSMNLAQAVVIALYEIRRAHIDNIVPFPHESASVDEIEGMYSHLNELYEAVRYFDAQNRERIPQILRRLLNRARPNSQEVRIIRGLCRNALHVIRNKKS